MNLLDNAIDASKKEEQKDLHITIGIVKQYLSVQIKNRSSVDVLAQNPAMKTHKPDASHHGLGLKIIRSIVRKYNGILQLTMESGYFCASVLLALNTGNDS